MPALRKATARASSAGLTAEEKAAMRETLKERARDAKATASREEGEKEVLAKIGEMPAPDRTMAKRIHSIVKTSAPHLWPKTWYGMPAYTKDGKVICFFQSGHKFKSRYATFGFQEAANLDDGDMWATSFALKKLTPADEMRIANLVKKAAS